MKGFLMQALRLPFVVYALSLLASVVWCVVLGIIDNEAPTTEAFVKRYLQPLMWLWYGLPVTICILWLTLALQQRGYQSASALKWSIPLGCLLGTVSDLTAFFVVFGIMKLTGLA